jgi:hypothetical protein
MSMQSYMAADLSELFTRDMPADCKIGAASYTVLLDDLLSEEVESYGGAEAMEMQRVHFQTTDKSSIEVGSKIAVRSRPESGKKPGPWKSKIVLSSITSADGNELIVTVRGD